MEEVIAATAYLDLFIRTATEPSLIHIFLKFVVAEKYEDVNILDSLVARIQSNSRVRGTHLSSLSSAFDYLLALTLILLFRWSLFTCSCVW